MINLFLFPLLFFGLTSVLVSWLPWNLFSSTVETIDSGFVAFDVFLTCFVIVFLVYIFFLLLFKLSPLLSFWSILLGSFGPLSIPLIPTFSLELT